MARDLAVEVRQAVVAALKGNTATAAIVSTNVFGPATPSPPPWPFIRVDLPIVTPDYDGCSDASRYRFNVHAFAKGADERAAGRLSAAVSAALDGLSGQLVLTPAAWLQDVRWTGTQLLSDTDEANGWHGVIACDARVAG